MAKNATDANGVLGAVYDDVNQALRVTSVGGGGGGSGDVVGPASSVASEVVLFDGTTGKLIKSATISGLAKLTSGVLSAAAAGTDYYAPGSTDVAVADGGTGASTAAAAATNLGLGTGDSPQFTAVNIGHASDTTLARSSAGVLAVEGNRIFHAGGTDVPIADGGTGQSTAAAAFDALAPTTTRGDFVVRDATTNTRFAVGGAGKSIFGGTDPSWKYASRVIATNHTTKTISSSSGWTTETTSTSVLNSALTVAAGTLSLGDTLRLQVHGTMVNNSGGSLAYTWSIGANTVGSVYVSGATSTLAASATARNWMLDITLACADSTSLTNLGIYGVGLLAVSGTTSNVADGLHAVGTLLVWSGAISSGLNVNTNDLSIDLKVASGGTTDTQSVTMRTATLTHIPKVT